MNKESGTIIYRIVVSFIVKLNNTFLKIKLSYKHYILFGLLGVLFSAGCAPQRKGPVADAYHNTTARYNAYFYAREHMDEIETAIENSNENNFNRILKIFPDIDTAVIAGLNEQIEKCLEKASIAIERHPHSKWTDDSYILVGLCRLYTHDIGNAVETFKYVNVNSEDDDARHRALVYLMRTFIEAGEQNNAIAVSDVLKKEKLNRRNKIQLHLTRAYLYMQREDYDNTVSNLLVAAPLMRNHEGKAKIYYIIGQIYQMLGFDVEAYHNYEKVLRANPEYELFFYARLNMAQVYDLSRNSDTRKIRKYFRKLLKDKKNTEFKDKIYYEMAAFEQKLGNLEEAIEYYNSSVAASVSNQRQKAYAYLALGKIYYEELKKYELAKAYYDSTMSVLPRDEDNYEQIANRQEVLANFVAQLNIIEEQDSLLTLAAMDTASLSAYLDQVIEERKAAEEAAQKEAARRQRRRGSQRAANSLEQFDNPFAQGDPQEQSTGENWYFYNTAALSTGQNAFIRKWGNRPLEDNWRRSDKNLKNLAADINRSEVNQADTAMAATVPAEQNISDEATVMGEKAQMMAAIPLTDSARIQAYVKIEEAYYNLGNIYNFDLEEPVNAVHTFDTLLYRFPDTEYKPEVLYQLYLITKQLEDEAYLDYKEQLLREFPNSTYARILRNPNYREESNAVSEQLRRTYKKAYELYKQKYYAEALQLLSDSLKRYPDNSFSDKMAVLQARLVGHTDGPLRYQLALQNFEKDYPESEYLAYVKHLQESLQGFKDRMARERSANYIPEFNQPHTFVLVYDRADNNNLTKELMYHMEVFNSENYKEANLTTANLTLEGNKAMIIVRDFSAKESANEYYKHFNSENSPLKRLSKILVAETSFNNFVITQDNFNIFYQTKDLNTYLRFFENNYGNLSIN